MLTEIRVAVKPDFVIDGCDYYTQESLDVILSQRSGKWSRRMKLSIVGNKFGRLTVLREFCQNGSQCVCVCDCGTEVTVRRADLLSGNTKSCGCLRGDTFVKHANLDLLRKASNRDDCSDVNLISLSWLPGHHRTADLRRCVFGRLTVVDLDRAYIRSCGKVAVIWRCVCSCGNEVSVDAQALRSGHTKSCGCYEKTNPGRLVDLTGQRFGRLVVLSRVVGVTQDRYAVWHCRCDCGNFCDVSSGRLVHGITSSCGCLKASKREMFVSQYFMSHGLVAGVDYFPQKSYSDLVGVGGRCLTYDFLLTHDGLPVCLIECQGEQHFQSVEWYGGREKFERQQEHDRRKKAYAEQLGIPFFEVLPECKTYDAVVSALRVFFHSIAFDL